MTEVIKVNHDVRCVDGKTIYMPPWVGSQEGWGNLELPNILVPDSTQKYPIGTKYVVGDRVFRYCKAGSTGLRALYAGYNANVPKVFVFAAGQGGLAGALAFNGGLVDGAGSNVEATKDEFAGGYIFAYSAPFQCLQVKSNTAATVAGSYITTVTLCDPLVSVLKTDVYTAIYQNIYSNVIWPASAAGFESVVVMPLVAVTATHYFWGQTWGPTHGLVAGGSDFIGKDSQYRQVRFAKDQGGMCCDEDDAGCDEHSQPAGFLLCNGNSFTNGDQFFMLQLAP